MEHNQLTGLESSEMAEEYRLVKEERQKENLEEVENGIDQEKEPGPSGSISGDPLQPPNVILEQDRFLPIANVSRLMRRMIPNSGKMAKEAKECVQESVSEFISFITSEASEKCAAERRKTITADDLLDAMTTLGFDCYIEPLRIFLDRYREATKQSSKLTTTADKVQPRPGSAAYASSSSSGMVDPTPAPCTEPSAVSNHNQEPYIQELAIEENVDISSLPGMQSVQILVDATSGQHYIAVNADGQIRLMPVEIAASGPPGDVVQGVMLEESSGHHSQQPPQLHPQHEEEEEEPPAPAEQEMPPAKRSRPSGNRSLY